MQCQKKKKFHRTFFQKDCGLFKYSLAKFSHYISCLFFNNEVFLGLHDKALLGLICALGIQSETIISDFSRSIFRFHWLSYVVFLHCSHKLSKTSLIHFPLTPTSRDVLNSSILSKLLINITHCGKRDTKDAWVHFTAC